ncbi:hypothetical protein VKI22_05455 [Cyanobacterium aponinum UTEX 3221]|uniref:bile acid:sodium symporter family protein n=1 Tax=Cyanobacterium aponinum TaxID=379064 RepID=UPI002B4BF6EE|nr:hypothetical protein [Cyanobacterium aponinum]WRL39537.1 hypothetical protein VKI22_05455 [Cyanobacterium aponinum UTEX 3221]
MESNFLTAIFLPLALFIIMLGMGLSLTLDDFKRVFVEPKAVIIGLIAQLFMLPIIGYFLALAFQLAPELAVGVMILATCPGGSTSNMITYLIKGNVALSKWEQEYPILLQGRDELRRAERNARQGILKKIVAV